MKALDYQSTSHSAQAPASLVALYWVLYTGAVVASLMALLLGLTALTDFGWIDDRFPPGTRRRLVVAAPYVLFAALALLPYRWTPRGLSYWTRLLLLLLPPMIVMGRLLLGFFRSGMAPSTARIVGVGVLLTLCLMPACALILWRHLRARAGGLV